jgi:hypothetical protein
MDVALEEKFTKRRCRGSDSELSHFEVGVLVTVNLRVGYGMMR